MELRQLIEKCVSRDASAFDEFTRAYYSHVLKCVRYKLKQGSSRPSLHRAEDIAQEIFMTLWDSDRLANLRDPASIKGFLAVLSINFTIDMLRKRATREDSRTVSLDMPRTGYEQETRSVIADVTQNCQPDRSGLNSRGRYPTDTSWADLQMKTHENRDMREIIEREMSSLSPKQSLALKLNLLEGLTQKDISQLLKIPENTVATLIRRGKSRLSERLKTLLEM